jgi:hypothetical protein
MDEVMSGTEHKEWHCKRAEERRKQREEQKQRETQEKLEREKAQIRRTWLQEGSSEKEFDQAWATIREEMLAERALEKATGEGCNHGVVPRPSV